MNDSCEDFMDYAFATEALSLSENDLNLRRKIESICRTIENLSAKKINIELEIRSQKRTLARKRLELKKRSKSTQSRIKVAIESNLTAEQLEDLQKFERTTQDLLRESAKILEE